MPRPQYVSDAITVDGSGLHVGEYEDLALYAAYQPIYARAGGVLQLSGFEGLIRPRRGEVGVPPGELFGRVSMADRLFIECMCRALHIRNYTHAAPAGADLFFNINPAIYETIAVVEREFDFMLTVLAHYGLGPERLVCEVVETDALDAEALKKLCVKLRMAGVRLALDDFGAGSSSMERFRDLKPDIIKVDGAWFRTMAGERASSFSSRGSRRPRSSPSPRASAPTCSRASGWDGRRHCRMPFPHSSM